MIYGIPVRALGRASGIVSRAGPAPFVKTVPIATDCFKVIAQRSGQYFLLFLSDKSAGVVTF